MSEVGNKYRMTVDLNVLNHLGEGLYSSVAAVLTEAVANAWDADAEEVRITIPQDMNNAIVISDDGIGMDENDINDRYLRVGYQKRVDGDKTPGQRPVMGRKGIGKLSLFSIANQVDISTKKEKAPINGLSIDYSKLRHAMEKRESTYYPEVVTENLSPISDHGTVITLRKLQQDRLKDKDPASIRRKLARRFSVIGSKEFRVFVNDEEVTVADRDDQKHIEYLWVLGDTKLEENTCKKALKIEKAPIESNRDNGWVISGWLGTVDKPSRLKTPEGNLNSIVLLSRGRLVDEDILPRIAGAEHYTQYLTGQITADFLDDTGGKDIITSNRQHVIEDDERVLFVLESAKSVVRLIANNWSEFRTRDKAKEIEAQSPKLKEWVKRLPEGLRSKAKQLIGLIGTLEIDSDSNAEEYRKTILRHAIYGFERLRIKGNTEALSKAMEKGVDSLLVLLSDLDDLEASLYLDIARNRFDEIIEIEKLADENKLEKVMQNYLFDHLWLLDPSWERATENPEMEHRLRMKNGFQDDDDVKKKYGRIDIKYRSAAGKHIIVELKRAGRIVKPAELYEQGKKYVNAVKQVLPAEDKDIAQIEVVFIIGKRLDEESNSIKSLMDAISPGSRIFTYEQLVIQAKTSYAAYTESKENADKIEALFTD